MSRIRERLVGFALAALGAVLATGLGCGSLGLGPRPAWELPPPPPREAPVVQPGALHRLELPNGLRGLLLEDHRLPNVALGVAVRRGSGSEPLEQAGVADFAAELMQRGAGARDALELAAVIDALGASLGVGASWDSMSVGVTGLSRDLDTLFEVLADVALRPRFEPGEGDKARAEILATLEQAKDDPGTLIGWHAARAVFGGHRYGMPREGTSETVRGLDAAAARAFYERVFTPSNAVVFASGDLTPEDFERRVRAAFAGWQGGEAPPPVAASPRVAPPLRRVVVVDKPDLGQSRIILAHDGLARSDDRRIGAGLMNNVLGDSGFSSRLMKRVRSEEGLTYGVWSGFGMRREPGPFIVETFTRVPETRRTIDLLLDSLEELERDPPSAKELAEAKSYAVGSFGLALETSDRVMRSLVDLDMYGLPEDSLDTYRRRVRAVEREDVVRLARELVHPERAAIVVLGPAQELVPQLEGLGEIEIEAP